MTEAPLAEDWGWQFAVIFDTHTLWVGCGNVDGEKEQFLCAVARAKAGFLGFFKKPDNRPLIAVTDAVDRILREDARITGSTWTKQPART